MEIPLCQSMHPSTFAARSDVRRRHFTYFICWLTCFCTFAWKAQAEAALIEGTVHADNGPLSGANIQLSATHQYAVSSDSGLFRLHHAPSGRFTLVVTHTGYQTVRYPVTADGNDTLFVDIYLRKSPSQLPATVVTGTRSPRFSTDAPVYTTLVTSDDIADQGAIRLGDVLFEQTGLNVIHDHGRGVQIQGFDPDYTLVLLDGDPIIGRTAGTLDLRRHSLGNVEQIEIVKGPTSSLYGSEAIAGVVNLITRRSESPFTARLQSRYATHSSADVDAEIGLMRDRFGLLFFGNFNRSDGYDLDPLTIDPTTPSFTNITLHPKITYKLGEQSDIRVGLRLNRENQHSRSAIQEDGISALLRDNHTTNDASLSAQVTWQPRANFDAQGKLYGALFSTQTSLTHMTSGERYSRSDFAQTYYKAESQFQITTVRSHLVTFGAGYVREYVEADRIADGRQTASTLFMFVQDEWALHPGLDLVLSARTDAHSDYNVHLSPKFAALFRPTSWLQLRAATGRGFKSPEFRQLHLDFTNAAIGYSVFGSTTLNRSMRELRETGQIERVLIHAHDDKIEPEKSTAYSFGIDLNPINSVHVRINFFRNNVRDLIETAPIAIKRNNQRVFSYFNINRVFTHGFESEVDLTIARLLDLGFGYQFLEAKDEDVVRELESGRLFALGDDGRSRAVRPAEYGGLFNRSRHSGIVKATYRHEPRGLTVTLRCILRGRYGEADRNANQILDREDEYLPGYALWNMTLRKRMGAFAAQVGVDNIFDKTDPQNIPSLPGRLIYTSLGRDF